MKFKKKLSAIMAAILAATAYITAAPQAGMDADASLVTLNTWQSGYIENLSDIGITSGYYDESSGFTPGYYNIYITIDTKKSSPTYYQTRGFTMQRCLATQEYTSSPERDPVNQDFITIKANQNQNIPSGTYGAAEGDEGVYYVEWKQTTADGTDGSAAQDGDRIYTIWFISGDLVEKKVKEASEEWYEYITTEPGFHYLKVDSLMTYYDNNKQMGDLLTRNGSYYVDGELYGVPDEINGLDGLLDYHSMPYFGSNTKLASHYDQHIDLQYIEGEEEPVEEEEDVESAESSYIDDFVRQYNTYSGNWASGVLWTARGMTMTTGKHKRDT